MKFEWLFWRSKKQLKEPEPADSAMSPLFPTPPLPTPPRTPPPERPLPRLDLTLDQLYAMGREGCSQLCGQEALDLAEQKLRVVRPMEGDGPRGRDFFGAAIRASGGFEIAFIQPLPNGAQILEFIGFDGARAWVSPNPKTGGYSLAVKNIHAPPDGACNIVVQVDAQGVPGPERYFSLHGEEVFEGDEALTYSFPRPRERRW